MRAISKETLTLSFAIKELRSGVGGLWVFIFCLALGVAALTAIGSLRESIHAGMHAQSAEVLGGDASMILTYRFASDQELRFIKQHSSAYTELTDFRSMVTTMENDQPIDSTLVSVKGVDSEYPLYGFLKLSPNKPIHELLEKRNNIFGLVVSESLTGRLNIEIGQMIKLGNEMFQLRGHLLFEPDAGNKAFSFAPRVIALNEGLKRSGLLSQGTMFDSIYNMKLDANTNLNDIKALTEKNFAQAGARWRDKRDAAPGIEAFVERLSLFLSMVGIAGLIIGGIGVGSAVQTFIEKKRKTIAIFKILGSTSFLVFKIYLLLILLVTGLGALAGAIFGALLPVVFGTLLEKISPLPVLIGLYPAPILASLLYGFMISLIFSIWPLAKIVHLKPAVLIRNRFTANLGRPPINYLALVFAISIIFISTFSLLSSQSLLVFYTFLGFIAAVLSFVLVGSFTRTISNKIANLNLLSNFFVFRLSIRSISRAENEVNLVMPALGIGLVVLATIAQVDVNLSRSIETDLSKRTPAFFLLDISKDQIMDFKKVFTNMEGIAHIETAPMMRGLISKINNVRISELDINHWAVRGDRGLTFREEPMGNVVEGEWWLKNHQGEPQISFAQDEASELGINLHDHITVNILGREITGEVTSLRDVNFSDMGINFLMVFNPSALEKAPYSYIATIYAQKEQENLILRTLNKDFVNITAIPMRETLSKVSETLSQIAAAIRISSIFTLISGLLVLVGVAAASEKNRIYEASILKTLGASRKFILQSLIIRSTILGVTAAVIAIIFACLSSWAILHFSLEGTYKFDYYSAIWIGICGIFTNLISTMCFAWRPISSKAARILRLEE